MLLKEESVCLKLLLFIGHEEFNSLTRQKVRSSKIRRAGISQGGHISNSLKKLMEMGLIEKTRFDGRGFEYSLTNKGIKVRKCFLKIMEVDTIKNYAGGKK